MKVRRSSSALLSLFSIVLFLLLFVSPRTLSAQGWRMEGRNPSRTNAVPVNGPEALPTFTALPNPIQGSLRRIAPDGSFVLVDPSGANGLGVVSVYATDGTPKWSVAAPNAAKIVDVAVATDGTVYVSTAGALSALNANTGASAWTFVTGASESSPLAIGSTGTIYFHSAATGNPTVETLSAINPDGSEKWQTLGSFRGNTRLVLSTDEQLAYLINTKSFLGSPIGNVSAYSTADGSKVSDTPCDPRGDVYVFAQWNVLYAGNAVNDLLSLSPDLQTCATVPTQGGVVGIATTTATGRIVAQNSDGTIKVLSQQGTVLWISSEPLTAVFSTPDGTIYGIAPISNAVVAINGETGAELWRRQFAETLSGLVLGDDSLLYATGATHLYVSASQPNLASLSASPVVISFFYEQGAIGPIAPQQLVITSSGAPITFTATPSVSSSIAWLNVTPSSTTPTSIDVTVLPGNLQPGIYNGSIILSSASATNNPLIIPVQFVIATDPNNPKLPKPPGGPGPQAHSLVLFPEQGGQVLLENDITIERSPDQITSDVTLQNIQNAWYFVSIQAAGAAGQGLPSSFLIGPLGKRTFRITFKKGEQVSFVADATLGVPPKNLKETEMLSVYGAELFWRAVFGSHLPQNVADLAVFFATRVDVFAKLAISAKNGNIAGVITAIDTIANNPEIKQALIEQGLSDTDLQQIDTFSKSVLNFQRLFVIIKFEIDESIAATAFPTDTVTLTAK